MIRAESERIRCGSFVAVGLAWVIHFPYRALYHTVALIPKNM